MWTDKKYANESDKMGLVGDVAAEEEDKITSGRWHIVGPSGRSAQWSSGGLSEHPEPTGYLAGSRVLKYSSADAICPIVCHFLNLRKITFS